MVGQWRHYRIIDIVVVYHVRVLLLNIYWMVWHGSFTVKAILPECTRPQYSWRRRIMVNRLILRNILEVSTRPHCARINSVTTNCYFTISVVAKTTKEHSIVWIGLEKHLKLILILIQTEFVNVRRWWQWSQRIGRGHSFQLKLASFEANSRLVPPPLLRACLIIDGGIATAFV